MRSLVVLVALTLALAACRSVATPTASAQNDDALGVAVSPCGRYSLWLDHAEWRGEPNGKALLSLQMRCETGEPDAFVCDGVRVTDLVSAGGVEWREKGLDGRAEARGRGGSVFVHGLVQYERADSVQRLRIECHVMRVLEWRTYPITCPAAGAEGELICPPYHVGVFGDPDTCSVSAYCTDDWRSFPAAQRDLFGLLGHDWVASGVELTDAHGDSLQAWGGAGSGGTTVAQYGPAMRFGDDALPLRYPLRGSLRLPARYVVEVVPFEFVDVRLVRE